MSDQFYLSSLGRAARSPRHPRPQITSASPSRIERLESRQLLSAAISSAAPALAASTTPATTVPDPLQATGTTFTGTEGANTGTVVVANFTRNNPALTSTAFSAIINWGDGTPLDTKTVAIVKTGVGAFEVTGNHTYIEESTGTGYAVTVTIHRLLPDGRTVVANSLAKIADAPLRPESGGALKGTEGKTIDARVASFKDLNPFATASEESAIISWGDGTTSAATSIVSTSPGQFNVIASHAYAEEGKYTISTQVKDDGGSSTVVIGSATIVEAPFSISGVGTINAVAGTALSRTVAYFTHVNPLEPAGALTASINWGDGTTTTGAVLLDSAAAAGHYHVAGTHTYAAAGTDTILVTVFDDGTTAASVTDSVNVTAPVVAHFTRAVGLGVTGHEGVSLTAPVASFSYSASSASLSTFSASIVWGDGATSTGTIVASGTGFEVVGTHTYSEEATYPVSVTISDGHGATASTFSAAHIADSALINPVGYAQKVAVNTSFLALLGSFNDLNPLNTQASEYSPTVIRWGDGSSSSAFVTSAGSNSVASFWSVFGTHDYTTTGVKHVAITVNDIGGASTTIDLDITVV